VVNPPAVANPQAVNNLQSIAKPEIAQSAKATTNQMPKQEPTAMDENVERTLIDLTTPADNEATTAIDDSGQRTLIDLTAADSNDPRTLLNLTVLRSRGAEREIWDFKKAKWVHWDLNKDPRYAYIQKNIEKAHELLWEYVLRLMKVIYFCTHQCRLEDVEKYIPKEIYLEVYTPKLFANLLHTKKGVLHTSILTRDA
jgi:hypothetical protein